jgi:hypothetical protein
MSFLIFIQNTFKYISKVLSKYNFKMVDLTLRKMTSFLHPITDDSGLKTSYACPASVGMYTLDKLDILSVPGLMNITITKGCINYMNRPQLNILVVLIWISVSI